MAQPTGTAFVTSAWRNPQTPPSSRLHGARQSLMDRAGEAADLLRARQRFGFRSLALKMEVAALSRVSESRV